MRNITRLSLTVLVMLALSACASSHRTVSTFDGPRYSGPGYNKILVIGMADSYNSRTSFERMLAQRLSSGKASATAFYTLVSRDDPIERDTVLRVVSEGGFDAVLVSRVVNRGVSSSTKSGTAMTKVTRKEGRPMDLFRYDYEELNEPSTLSLEVTIVMASELYDAATQSRAWAIETEFARTESVAVVVSDAVDIVASRIARDGLIAK